MHRRSLLGSFGAGALLAACAHRDDNPAPAATNARKPGSRAVHGDEPFVLVELFSSEGCSSCPPAEAITRDLDGTRVAGHRIVTLEYHVDYWDDLGWRDPFSHARFTERQRAYREARGRGSIFTPEAIVDGRASVVASRRDEVLDAVRSATHVPKTPLALSLEGDAIVIALASEGRDLEVTCVVAERDLSTEVERGENSGLHLVHGSVVRDLRSAEIDASGRASFPLDSRVDPAKRLVVALVTSRGSSTIVALGAV